jgi:uncharacterized protein YecA (UPF0149 family)
MTQKHSFMNHIRRAMVRGLYHSGIPFADSLGLRLMTAKERQAVRKFQSSFARGWQQSRNDIFVLTTVSPHCAR